MVICIVNVSERNVGLNNAIKGEYEILKLFTTDSSTLQIASSLKISLHTMEIYRKHLWAKFKAKNSSELFKKASKVCWFE